MANRRQKQVEGVFATAVADAGTVTVAYPSGTNQAYFTNGNASARGQLVLNDSDVLEEGAETFSLTYGGSNITLTNLSGGSWAAGTKYRLGLAYATEAYAFSGQKSAAITSLTDNSGGTASDTLAAIADTATNNAVASNAAKINRILAALRAANIIES